MKPMAWKVLSALLIVAFVALLAIGLVGGCGGMVETAAGGQVPMRCHWAFLAVSYVAALGVVAGLLALVSPQLMARRVACIMAMAAAIVTGLLPSPLGIGVCASPDMSCTTSAPVAFVVSAIAFAISLAMCIKADPQAADKPKRTL